mgnify:CR=1 FL=1
MAAMQNLVTKHELEMLIATYVKNYKESIAEPSSMGGHSQHESIEQH